MLQANGMEVKSLTGGASLFETINKEKPDIILMDIFLGDSDGRQLCKELKSSGAFSGFPVFLYSAANISNASIIESNADAFLPKPFDMKSLVRRMHEVIKKNN